MKKTLLIGLALVAAGGSVAAFMVLRQHNTSGTQVTAATHGGEGVAAGLKTAVRTATSLTEPYRCARGDLTEASTSIPLDSPSPYVLRGAVLRATTTATQSPSPVVIGIVSDARGPTTATLAQLRALVQTFEARKVSLVVSLGGMGQRTSDIEQTLSVLTAGHRWLTIAIPGDRESVPAHRAAISALAKAGHHIVDGAQVRLVFVGGAAIGTFPGTAHVQQMVAGVDGCVHSADDATALATALTRHTGPRLWLGHAPARQRGLRASDVATGGIHIGEQLIADAIRGRRIALVVNGLVDEAALGMRPGSWTGHQPTTFLAAGAIEAAPVANARGAAVSGAALTLAVTPKRVRWQPIRF